MYKNGIQARWQNKCLHSFRYHIKIRLPQSLPIYQNQQRNQSGSKKKRGYTSNEYNADPILLLILFRKGIKLRHRIAVWLLAKDM
jgi:hypothetical protein